MALAGIFTTTRVLRFFRFPRNSVNFRTETQQNNVQQLFLVNNADCKYYCTDTRPATPRKPGADPFATEKKKKKGLTSPQITLITPEDEVHAMTMEQAEKLSKRRNLKLVKIVDFDTKTQKPVYKLMTALEFFQEDLKSKEKKKKEKESAVKESKLFTLSSKIGHHDLDSKVRQMFKLLKKKHEVRIFIAFDGNPDRGEELGKLILEELKEVSAATECKPKGNSIKLSVLPKMETVEAASGDDAASNKQVEKQGDDKKEAAAINEKK